jgi:hypothetical protein
MTDKNEHRENVRRYIDLIGLGEMSKKWANTVVGQYRAHFGADVKDEELPPNMLASIKLVEKTLLEKTNALLERFIDIYVEGLPPSVLSDLITFYESEAGRTLRDKGETLQNKVVAAGDEWANAEMKGIEKELAELLG